MSRLACLIICVITLSSWNSISRADQHLQWQAISRASARLQDSSVQPAAFHVPQPDELFAEDTNSLGVRLANHMEVTQSELTTNKPKEPHEGFVKQSALLDQLADRQDDLAPIFNIAKWLVVVLFAAVSMLLGLKKWNAGKFDPQTQNAFQHEGTLTLAGHMQAHLLRVGDQKYLVTSDRTGVKTVTPVNAWPVEESWLVDESHSDVEFNVAA